VLVEGLHVDRLGGENWQNEKNEWYYDPFVCIVHLCVVGAEGSHTLLTTNPIPLDMASRIP
jgi:hypothetical protein